MDLKCFDIIGFVIILKRFPFFIISAGGVFIVKMVHSEVCVVRDTRCCKFFNHFLFPGTTINVLHHIVLGCTNSLEI